MSLSALVGPALEENLSLRDLASSLRPHGFDIEIVGVNQDSNFSGVLASIREAEEPPLTVGISDVVLPELCTSRLTLSYALELNSSPSASRFRGPSRCASAAS